MVHIHTETLGDIIKKVRQESGITMEELAFRLDVTPRRLSLLIISSHNILFLQKSRPTFQKTPRLIDKFRFDTHLFCQATTPFASFPSVYNFVGNRNILLTTSLLLINYIIFILLFHSLNSKWGNNSHQTSV